MSLECAKYKNSNNNKIKDNTEESALVIGNHLKDRGPNLREDLAKLR